MAPRTFPRPPSRTYAHLHHDDHTTAALAIVWLTLGIPGVAWCAAREVAFRLRRWLV